jgi:hypothetical protein
MKAPETGEIALTQYYYESGFYICDQLVGGLQIQFIC